MFGIVVCELGFGLVQGVLFHVLLLFVRGHVGLGVGYFLRQRDGKLLFDIIKPVEVLLDLVVQQHCSHGLRSRIGVACRQGRLADLVEVVAELLLLAFVQFFRVPETSVLVLEDGVLFLEALEVALGG